ncbi:MAG TPA: hypothetical protein VN541_00775, partial [Tepidisphaeraceae bacterium]|nr:hypothetical protein [Tepidisphaeraceae bacterium]
AARMIICDGTQTVLASVTDDGIKTTPLADVPPLPAHLNTGIDLWIDHLGRVWLPRSEDAATLVEGSRARAVDDTGLPRLEDSAGRIWFVNPARKQLVVLFPDGRKAHLGEPALSDDSTVVEDKPGSYWLNTRSGLRHINSAAGFTETSSPAYFEKGIPKGACNGLWVDPEHALWFSGSGRLYRIKLP